MSSPTDNRLRPYHPKRPHNKTRTGCVRCKERRVKCNELRPSCRQCRVRKENCVYLQPLQRGLPSGAGSSTNAQELERERSHITQGVLNLLWEPEYRMPVTRADSSNIVWFFRQNTCHSFSVTPHIESQSARILRDISTQASYTVPFLRSSIIALTAMHMESLNIGISPQIACVARERSYAGYREAIEEAHPSKFPSLIVNSLIITAISSCNFRDPEGPDLYILDWMVVWRGIAVMMDMVRRQTVTDSGLDPLFERPDMDPNSSGEGIPLQLEFLVLGIWADSDPDTRDRVVYTETLNKLGVLYRSLEQGLTPSMYLQIVTWLTMIPPRFIEICREKRPRALIIVAYYAAFLKLVQGVWWLVGVGDRIIHDIVKELGVQWNVHLYMPIRARSAEGNIAIGRAILNNDTWLPTLRQAEDAEMSG